MIIKTKFDNLNGLLSTRYHKSAPSAPETPDYKGAAEQTAAGNLEAARASAAANRINQVTPYGQVTYSQDPNAPDPDHGWTQTTSLSPVQQQLLDRQNSTSLGLANLQDTGLGFVNKALQNGISMATLPKNMVNAGQTGQDALMARFQPQIDKSRAALTTQLANQGINPGSEAWNNAMRDQSQSENDLKSQAALNGIRVGMDAQNQQMSLQAALQHEPLNILNAVRTGSQVTNPQFSNYAQQGQTAGADYSGAMGQQTQYNQGLYNSQVASANAGNSAAMSAIGGIAAIF